MGTALPDLPTRYVVRDVVIDPNVVLAPMEGVTDVTFRRLVRRIGGCGLTTTEFIPSEGIKRGIGKVLRMAEFDPDERPIAIQIYGRRPDTMAEAARIVADMGADIVDINMGCPSKKVVAHSGGSALMRDPQAVQQIVRAVRAAITLPLTVKMRSGFDHSQRNAPEIAWICQEEGAEAVVVHWRTRSDQYSGVRNVDKIAQTKARLSVPVIANGDVVDVQSAVAMLRETGADGLMIGRGAVRDPWVLKRISSHLRGEPSVTVTANEREGLMMTYFEDIEAAVDNPRFALGRFKMLTRYFTHGLPHGKTLRTSILRSPDAEAARAHARRYFDALRRLEAGDEGAFDSWGPTTA